MNGPVFLLLVGVGGALIPVFELTQRKQSMKDCGRSTRGVAGGTPLACSASSLSEAVVRQRSRSRPDAPVGMSSPGHLHRVVGVRELMRQRRSPTILATATTRPAVTPRWGTYSRVSLPPATTSNAVYNLANRLTPWNGAVVSRQQLEPDLRRARSPTRTTPATSSPWFKQGNRSRGSTCTRGWDVGSPARSQSPRPSPAYEGWNLLQERANNNSVSANYPDRPRPRSTVPAHRRILDQLLPVRCAGIDRGARLLDRDRADLMTARGTD
jgi:hypothetical protein